MFLPMTAVQDSPLWCRARRSRAARRLGSLISLEVSNRVSAATIDRLILRTGGVFLTSGGCTLQWIFVKVANSARSEEHTSELQPRPHLVCRLLLQKDNLPPMS